MKKSSDILLTLEHASLEVWKLSDGKVCVKYGNCFINDGIALIDAYGRGSDFELACIDYLARIRGKTLVFESFGKKKEVTVLG